ncbi:MAG: hypothetical protein N2378_08135 [Chloroflexaceae bacterium]|nr:hypothetical protein [Chloroflexaceae bacterium]
MPGTINQKAATISFSTAELLAADLAGAGVDPNEAQKALAYLRSKRDPKAFFDYLQAIVTNGRAVIRLGQTLDYYRNLQGACQRHLRGMAYEEMALTLGWALRLLRYYRAVPWAAKEKAAEPRAPGQASQQAAAANTVAATGARPQPAPPAAPARELPAVGATFTGKVIDGDDQFFAIEVPGFKPEQVFAALKVEPGVPKYRVGKDSAKVEVTGIRETRTGKTVLDVRRPAKQG